MKRPKKQEMARRAKAKHPELIRLTRLKTYIALSAVNRELVKAVALYRRPYATVCNELGIANATHHFNQKNIQDCLRAFKGAGGSPIVPPPVAELALEIEKAAKAEPKPEPVCVTNGCDKPVRFNNRLCAFHGALSIGLEATYRKVPPPPVKRPGDPPGMTVVPIRPETSEPTPALNAVKPEDLWPTNPLDFRGDGLANSERIWRQLAQDQQEERQRLIRELEARETANHWR